MGTNDSGSLSTSISGLPFAFSAQVKVTGPNNYKYEQNIPGGWTETLTGLAPGTYTLQPQPVPIAMAPRNMYFPTQGIYMVTVTAQNTTTQSIPYSYQPTAYTSGASGGGLAISILGVYSTNAGLYPSAQTKVTGPYGYSSTLNISIKTAETLTGLAPGTYALQPQPVPLSSTRDTFFPAQESYTVTVTAQNITTQTIPYNLSSTFSNVLTVSISGLPSNLSAQVKVTGPYGYSSTLNIAGGATQGTGYLAPGTYTLQPQLAGAPSIGWFPAWFPDQMSYTVTATGRLTIPYSYHT